MSSLFLQKSWFSTISLNICQIIYFADILIKYKIFRKEKLNFLVHTYNHAQYTEHLVIQLDKQTAMVKMSSSYGISYSGEVRKPVSYGMDGWIESTDQ